jgi:RES domain
VRDSEKQMTSAKDIGAPEAEHASQNRMSPAGIRMVYCALEPETAVAEPLDCAEDAGKIVWTAKFYVREPILIVDLGLPPEVPPSSICRNAWSGARSSAS